MESGARLQCIAAAWAPSSNSKTMTQTATPSLGTHYSRYLIGNVLVLVASFISFPVLTRLLDNRQYGIFGYFDTWLLVLLALVKLGAQHSIIRFYPHGEARGALRSFVSSFVLAPFRYAIALWAVLLVGYYIVSRDMETEVRAVGWCMMALLLPQVWTSLINALIGIEERSGLYMRLAVAQRWLEMLAIVGSVYYLERSAIGAYAARVVVAVAMALWMARWLHRTHQPRFTDAQPATWMVTLPYSIPLIANEISGSLLGLLDRVMLKHVLDDFVPVGIFAVGAGLAATLNSVINQALSVAFTQVSMRQYALEGAAVVVRTKRDTLRFMVYACALLVTGLICVGTDFLLMLSGVNKIQSAPVFVALGCCYLIYGLVDLCGSGLLLRKRSKTVLALNVVATLVTTLVNLWLIPRQGVQGAIYATFAGYAVLGLGQLLFCPPDLRALPDARALFTALALGALLFGVAEGSHMFGLERPVLRFFAMAPLSVILFVVPAVALDPVLRLHAAGVWRRLRARRAR
jgi:O-antigen/teichoic acid export membrane protein